jgi:hypothetical protein
MADLIFQSAALVKQFLHNKAYIGACLYSNEFYNMVLADFRDLADSAAADKLFSQYAFPIILNDSPSLQIEAWERVLEIMEADDPYWYQQLHKGTVFYFAGMAAYYCGDFEKAIFYMDAALEEDFRADMNQWPGLPAGRFVMLDNSGPQAAQALVTRTLETFEVTMRKIRDLGGTGLSVDDYRNNLVRPAIAAGSVKRSAVTGFLSFLLEFRSRAKELRLAGTRTSTGEPFFLHLFKGALLFETLLKTSAPGLAIQHANPKATINNLVTDGSIFSRLGFVTPPQGLGAHTFEDILRAIKADKSPDFSLRAVRATWGIRNTTGHSLGWPGRPDTDEYATIYHLITGALTAALKTLHP